MQMIRKSIPLALAMVLVNLFLPWWGFTLLALSSAWLCNRLKDSMLISAQASLLSWIPLLIYSYIKLTPEKGPAKVMVFKILSMVRISGSN